MALDDIIKKIQEDADKKVKSLQDEYENEKQERLAEFNDYKEKFLEKTKKDAEEKAQLHRERLISRAQADANLELLKKKQELLSRVYKDAREKISKMDDQKKISLFADILEDIGIQKGTIIVPEGSTLDSDAFMKAISNKFDKANFERKTTDEFDMGFVLKTGKIRYDNTLDSLMAQSKEILQDRLVEILFAEQE
ncbi:MAG: V-type ATP synthase subunit E [Candidatus Zixiibacteriota bacterium]